MLASAAAVIVFIAAPVLGAVSDQASRRLPFLAVSTVLCITATFLLAQATAGVSFLLFVVAVVCFQAGLIFYDSLLPEVSTDANRGRIGGIGVGVGYIGSLLAYAIGTLLLPGSRRPSTDYAAVFRGIAIGFLVFAVPAFLFVRERPRVAPPLSGGWRRWRSRSWRRRPGGRRYRGVLPFLVGRMFYADAANTLIVMVVLYATDVVGMTDGGRPQVAIVSIVAAIPAGIAWGRVVDRSAPSGPWTSSWWSGWRSSPWWRRSPC